MIEYYIPYKFHDSSEPYNTTVHCRGIDKDDYRSFKLVNSPCIIVEPFVYEDADESVLTTSLKKEFRTSKVTIIGGEIKSSPPYLIKDYSVSDFKEDDYKFSKVMGDDYTTMIALNKKRFFNLFTKNGDWTSERSVDYDSAQKHHIIITYNSALEHLMYKRASGASASGDGSDPSLPFQILSTKQWKEMMDDVDIIFTDLTRKEFEDIVVFEVPNRIDFASVDPSWLAGYTGLHTWYTENIEDLYRLAFISSRNMSDLVSISDRRGWKHLTDDILLSLNLDIYKSPSVEKFNTHHCVPGRYSNVYVYHLGDILLKFLELGGSDGLNHHAWKFFRKFGRWNFVISEVFNRYILNPLKFSLPDQCFYMDESYIFTYEPITTNFEPCKKIDYMIALCEGSYITFNGSDKSCVFKGTHPLAKPLFPAVKKAVENYMLCNSRNFDVNIEAITDMADKNKSSLSIPITVTKSNLEMYRDILDPSLIEKFDLNKVSLETINVWVRKCDSEDCLDSPSPGLTISCTYDGDRSIPIAEAHIRDVLYRLDRLEQHGMV